MNQPLPACPPEAAGSPRAIGGHRLFDRLEPREVGVAQLAQKEGSQPVLMWWVDAATLPEVGATWSDVVRAMRAVTSPHVLAIQAEGEQGSIRWMTFPYVAGETLGWILRRLQTARSRMPWELATRIVIDAARALDALHGCREGARSPWPLHGSISGDTFSVAFDGRTTLFDPGRLFPIQEPSSLGLAYSSPERVWSEPSDARADVFSLAVLLWELCAGRRLFQGRDDDETRALLEAHVVPELATRVKGTPAKLDALIVRALAQRSADRIATAAELGRELEALFAVGGATSAEVAKYMRAEFADRDRQHRMRLEAASEVTEIRPPASSPAVAPDAVAPALTPLPVPLPAPPSHALAARSVPVVLPAAPQPPLRGALLPEDATLTHQIETPTLDSASATTLARQATKDVTTHPVDDRTLPRIGGTGPLRPLTGETKRVSFDAATRSVQLPVIEPTVESTTLARRVDDGELETLPRITNIDAQLAVVLEAEDLESVSDPTQQPATRRKSVSVSDDEVTSTELETQAKPAPAVQLRSEDATPTQVRPETRPRRAAMDVSRPIPIPTPAAGMPPSEAYRGNAPLPPPPRPPRRNSEGAMRARPERGERADRVETELDSPVYVRPPPPAPPPPRPPPRTPPPPQAALGPNTAPHGVATFGGLHGAQTAGQLQPAEHEVAGSNGWAQRAPFAQQAHPFQQAHYAQPMQQAQAYAVPPPTPFVSAPQPQHQLSQQPSAPQHYNPQEAPTKGRVVFQQHPQHGEPHDGSADSSVSYGPSPPAPSTVVEEPDEKVIVAAPQPSPFANAPRPLTAEMPVNGSGGFPVSHASPNFNEPTANREPLLLPRDPHMPAMQRALLAREAVRESDRRIALPVVIVAFVVAVGVAIGIPLLARRPSRVVTVPPASAEPSSLPGAVAGPSVTGPPVLPAPTQPTAVSTLPTGFVPPPGVMVPPVNPASPNPVTQAPTVAQPPRQAVTAQAPVAQRPAPRNPKPRPRQDPVPKPRPEPDEPIAAVPREPPTPREKDPPPTTSGAGKGLLTVICNPACDDVLDGSRSLGASPVFKASVSAGTHRLTLRISDPPLEKVVTVTVSPDETTVLTQPMTK